MDPVLAAISTNKLTPKRRSENTNDSVRGKIMNHWKLIALAAVLGSTSAQASLLIDEKFDDASLSNRGWYDNTNQLISTSEHLPNSAGSVQYTFKAGASTPTSGGAIRRIFAESDSVYISYYVKYSSNWVGSGRSYHPHQFYLLTNLDDRWSGLASTHLTSYIEDNGGRMQFVIQDSLNIDQNRINVDLTDVTESRAVAGCNGNTDGYPSDCYAAGSSYRNGKTWKANTVSFTSTEGPTYKGDWHHVETYVKLNSIVGGKGVADGVVKMWVDGSPVLDLSKVLLRTGQHANMRFNQIAIGPYIGGGSPVEQTFWVDNLTVATERPVLALAPPSPPRNVRTIAR
jgi:hypothetical protein